MRQVVVLCTLMYMLCVEVAVAGFDSLVKDVFPSGTMSNSTASALVKEQAAGHFVGGSSIIKTPADPKLQLLQVQAPSCKLGGLPCGAQVELLGGSVSLVSGKKLMSYLKSLPANAGTYALMMAIKTKCSVCNQLLEYIDGKADQLNQLSLDQCQMMQSLMDPLFAKEQAKEQAVRQSAMVLTGEGKDMAYFQEASKEDSGDPTEKVSELESQLGENYNLVWKALSKKAESNDSGSDLKQLLMSISGTIVRSKGDEKKPSIKHFKSLVSRDLIKQFIGGNGADSEKMRLYVCDEKTKCLAPKVKELAISRGSFLFQRVQKLVASMTEKILKNQGTLTSEEETLISLSSDQLILKIEMDLATFSNKANVVANQVEYIEALCFDVVTQYLQGLLVEVQEAVGEYGNVQMGDAEKFAAFERETREVMWLLVKERSEARARYELLMRSKDKLRRDVDYFERSFESFLNS